MAVRLDGLDEPKLPERDDPRDPERRRADGRGLRRHALVHRRDLPVLRRDRLPDLPDVSNLQGCNARINTRKAFIY